MANNYSNEVIENLIWQTIGQSSCAQDHLSFTRQFYAANSPLWFRALDQAVSLFSPESEAKESEALYGQACERVKEFALQCKDDREKAIALFNLGKMAAHGFGCRSSKEDAIRYYKQAIAYGEPRAMINCASFYEEEGATESDLAFADELYRQALEKGEPMGYVFQAGRLTEQDDPERFRLNLLAAERDCPIAMHRVGVALMGGRQGQEKDVSLGLSWLTRAAKAGCTEASYFLGWHYDQEKTRDSALAVEWHRLGAAQGGIASMRVLGINYILGEVIEKDESQAMLWVGRAAVLDDRYAQFEMGRTLINGEDPELRTKGVAWLKRAADNGHNYAAWRIALAYREGTLCEKDLAKSTQYCAQAAKAGYPEAQGQLGLNYWYGSGIEKDYALAHKWISMCAFQGEARGLYLLGLMHDQGIGCAQNYDEALRLYREAADKGELDALRQVGECYYFGHGVEQDYAQAMLWYQKAAAKGHAKAMTDLGWLLKEGEGVMTNYEEAIAWFTKAANLDEPRAMYLMALLYESGDGVEENEELCRRWMSRAAMLDYEPAKDWMKAHLPKAPQWLEQLVNPNE